MLPLVLFLVNQYSRYPLEASAQPIRYSLEGENKDLDKQIEGRGRADYGLERNCTYKKIALEDPRRPRMVCQVDTNASRRIGTGVEPRPMDLP